MNQDDLLETVSSAAARNNAEWCDAFCRTHGVTGRFRAGFWSSTMRTPPYYPDAVTLRPTIEVDELLRDVDSSKGCSIKDSFATLDLTAYGFHPLFRAEWLLCESGGATAGGWSTVAGAQQLAAWEVASADPAHRPGFFNSALLAHESIAVLARHDGDRIVAGAVASRSATVIGLSNIFDTTGDLASAWLGGAAVARALWGSIPIVGYDSGASLAAAHQAGFASIGELVVWLVAA